MNLKFSTFLLTIGLINTSFIHISNASTVSEKDFNDLKEEVKLLKQNISALKSSGTAIASVDKYIRNNTCTLLTTQPANACSDANSTYCYSVSSFVDANNKKLSGYTFTATKTTADYTNMDGGVWLCDNTITRTPLINQCTKIGGNAHTRAANAVEFTIPYGTITTPIIIAAYKNQFGGINGSSKLTGFSVCLQNIADDDPAEIDP